MSLDNILERAKEVFETAYKKTGTAVRQRLDASSLERELSKKYEQLGRLYLACSESSEEKTSAILNATVDEIRSLKAELAAVRSKMNKEGKDE